MAEPTRSEDQQTLALAAELHRPLARAARLGRANGGGYLVFGVLSLAFTALDPDALGLVVGAMLVGVGVVERSGAARMARGDPVAPRRMARAELALLATIVVYGVLGLFVLPSAGEVIEQQLGGSDALGMDVVGLSEAVNTLWYGLVIVIGLAYQGSMARYFLRRKADVARYSEGVPEWARRVVQSI
jgi:uncharacterized membrane protein HdeD (DUF308 family)